MNKGPLVSIITPCYNGAQYLQRFLDSILSQTYCHIELIFVNDGSTDNTETILLSYKKTFENKGIKLVYISQENKGLGEAINAGLKKVTGKYLCWPDADDYLEPESVELRLQVLERFPEFAVVTSDAYIRSIENINTSLGLVSASFKTNDDPNQFIHLLNGKSIFCSGTHMVRTNVFFETHPSGEIYPARKGQNYQMLLPLYYLHKRYFLNKPLYNYVRYNSSMSQIANSNLRESIIRNNHHRDIVLETLSTMIMAETEKTYYRNIVNVRYSSLNFNMAFDQGDYELLKKEYYNIKKLNQISLKQKLKFIVSRSRRILLSSFEKHNVQVG
jgi:glycosyltransferase involved in cell wall biosynthesis